jgi:arginase family enzyme
VLKRIGRYDLDSRRELPTVVRDRGDLPLGELSIEQATGPIREAVGRSVAEHALTLLIGGNNAVTRPGLLGLADALGCGLERIGLITLDAHFDMRGLEAGLSNGNPVRALREEGLPGRNVAQLGLAPFANSRTMHEDALAGGHLVISLEELRLRGVTGSIEQALERLAGCTALMVDCDIDVLDRSQFPGAPGGRPGGMRVEEFMNAVRQLAACPKVRVVDLTEWDPPLDPSDLSALTAGRWLAEVLSGFEQR